jgi:excisionase family DNA binding protein
MIYSNLPKILTPDEIADYLRISVDVVNKEMEHGLLKGFKVGTEWRCTDTALIEYVNRNGGVIAPPAESAAEYHVTDFNEIGPFDYRWPKAEEHFEYGFETTREISGQSHTFRVGFTDREAAGLLRRRVVVWMDNWPVVEFAGGNNFEKDGLMASIIKTKGGKQLRPSARIPDEYKSFRVDKYDTVVQGPYSSRNMAIIVDKKDLEPMVRHSIIRATLKQLL